MDKKRYAGVIVKCNDKVLLCKRNNKGSWPGMWSIPAGHVKEDEPTKDCAIREFYEETDVDISNEDLEFVGMIPRYTRDGKKVKGLMYVYMIEVDEEIEPDLENAMDGDEHTDFGYFTYDEISSETSGKFLYKLLEIVLTN